MNITMKTMLPNLAARFLSSSSSPFFSFFLMMPACRMNFPILSAKTSVAMAKTQRHTPMKIML